MSRIQPPNHLLSPLCHGPFTGPSLYLLAALSAIGTLLVGGAQAQEEEWKLARVEAVVANGNIYLGNHDTGIIERITGLEMPSGNFTVNTKSQPAASPSSWTATLSISYAFPATIPQDISRIGTVSAGVTVHDPRDPNEDPPPLAMHFSLQIHEAFRYAPVPPNPAPFTPYGWDNPFPKILANVHNFPVAGGDVSKSIVANPAFESEDYTFYGGGKDKFFVYFPTPGNEEEMQVQDRTIWLYPVYEMATVSLPPIEVTSLADEGDDGNYTTGHQTLREALERARNEPEEVTDVTIPIRVTGEIELTKGSLTIPVTGGRITIENATGGEVTLDGMSASRILVVPNAAKAQFVGISFVNATNKSGDGDGGANMGGAILNDGELWLFDCELRNNSNDNQLSANSDDGGAIFNRGELGLISCILSNNYTPEWGGAIFNDGMLRVERCRFVANRAASGAHLWTGPGSTTSLRSCQFYGGLHAGSEISLSGGNFEALNCLIVSSLVNSIGVSSNVERCELKHCTILASRGDRGEVYLDSNAHSEFGHCMIAANVFFRSDSHANFNSTGYNVFPPEVSATHSSDIIGRRPNLAITDGGLGVSLLPYGPGVNGGDPGFDPANPLRDPIYDEPPLTVDVFGNPRVLGGKVDIGAIEVNDYIEYFAPGDADENNNRVPDLIDVLSGIDPRQPVPNEHPKLLNEGVATADQPPFKSVHKTVELRIDEPADYLEGILQWSDNLQTAEENPKSLDKTVELLIDERADFLEGTLQWSDDLRTWKDFATYRPLGAGMGYERTSNDGIEILDDEQSGYGWFIREQIEFAGESGFLRLKASLLGDPGAPIITSPSTAEGITTGAFSYQIVAEGATSFTAVGLPEGLLVEETTGEISGMPTETGEFVVIITASNTEGARAFFDLTLSISPDTTQEGLVAWYPFDGDAQDASGQDNHGTLGEGDLAPQLTHGRDGQANFAYKFDGASFIQLTDSLPIGSSDNTVAVWVHIPPPEELGNIRVGVILGNYRDSPNSNWEIFSDGATRLYWNNGQIDARRGEALWGTGWRHVAWVRDTNAGQFLVYIDGVAQDPITAPGKDVDFTGRVHRIGGDNRDANGGPGFQGDLDDLRIYNRALTAVEIQALAGL